MPIHDWSRVDAGIFHYFHQRWIGTICDSLNEGLLPEEYYALIEQRSGDRIPDVLTLMDKDGHDRGDDDRREDRQTAVKTRPKTTYMVESDAEIYLRKKNRLAVRHVSDDRIVALVEIVSSGNKSGRYAFQDFTDKVLELLRERVHVLVIDLLPRTKRDPRGIHSVLWEMIADERLPSGPKKKPLTLVSYEAGDITRGYFEPVAVGMALPKMPLFLESDWHVDVPLEASYMKAYQTVPRRWRRVIEAGTDAT